MTTTSRALSLGAAGAWLGGRHWATFPVVLAAGAVVIYAYLALCYEEFYGRLAVDPSDVGLNYAGVLARSTGFVAVYLLVAALFIGGAVIARRGMERQRPTNPARARRAGCLLMVAMALFAAYAVSTLRYPLRDARRAARAVQAGKPVSPTHHGAESTFPLALTLGLPLLAIHADPATVEPAGKPEDAPAAERLRGQKVLYLGQANGTVVLYDPAAQQAVYLPASAIILKVTNCDAEPSALACSQLRRY
jgi:hypothetical protein